MSASRVLSYSYGRSRAKVTSGYEHLQSLRSGDTKRKDGLKVMTKSDKEFEGTKHIHLTSARLHNAATVITEYCAIFSNKQSSRTKIIQKSQHLKRYIIPLLHHAADTLEDAGKVLAPIASVKYVHDRVECKRKRDVVDPNNGRMSPDLQLVSNYVREVTPPRKKARTSSRAKLDDLEDPHKDNHIDIQAPSNGYEYRKPEVVKILSMYEEGSDDRGKACRKMIRLGYVPCHERTLRRLMEKKKLGKPVLDNEWTNGGRPAICSLEEIKSAAQGLETHLGRTYGDNDLVKILTDHHQKKMEEAGFVSLAQPEFSPSTLDNYSALLADQGNISISKSVNKKNDTRFASENSLRAALSLLSLVGATHFVPVDKEDDDIRAELKALPQETRKLIDCVSDSLGVPLFPVNPAYIFSTDDTTEYTFEGTKGKDAKFVLATKSSIKKRGTNSLYKVANDKSFNGMRVKLTFTFSAMGNCFPLVVTVTGLTEKELPGKDFVHVKIPGLCIGGGGVSQNDECGHLFLMRNTEGAEKARYEHYHEECFFPEVANQRKMYGDFDDSEGTTIPDKLTSVSWCDGDLSQIAAVKKSVEKFTELKIIANKQNAARSGVEQPADLARVFNIIKELLPDYTVKGLPVDRVPFKKTILKIFEQEELKYLSLKTSKKNALIDFLCVLPRIATKACTVDNIQHGFIAAGIIDADRLRYPVFNKILSTCRLSQTIEEYDNILTNFEYFLRIMIDEGRIPEEHFDLYGIRVDRDVNDNEVHRLAGIQQEYLQRCKCLTHHVQVKLRKERLLQLRRKEMQRREVANGKHQQAVEANRAVVDVLCKKLQDEGRISDQDFGEKHLEHCSLEMMFELKNPQLEAFILAHDPKYQVKSKIPKKGTLDEAKLQTDGSLIRNRTRIAYDCRTLPNLIEDKQPYDLSELVWQEDGDEEAVITAEVLTLTNDDNVLPSTLLSNKAWVKYTIDLFDLEKLSITGEVSDDEKQKADLAVRMLRGRFKEHVKSRIKTLSKQNHWSMKLAYKNLAVSAACMILTNHAKMDLKCLDESACLLAVNTNSFLPCTAFPNREGAYLYFDINRGVFVRSGKVSRRGFVARGKEHSRSSKETQPSSHFYFVYPSKTSSRAEKRDKQGYFEHLTQVIAAGFDPSSQSAKQLDKDFTEGGLLILDAEEKELIRSSMNKDLASIQKFQDIVAYQLEFGYDLAISPEHNVSRNPGFESVLGVFG